MARPDERQTRRQPDLHLLGVSFRTAPVAVREALHFDREQALGFLQELSADHPDLEVLVVSTCNRSEFYLVSGDGARAVEALLAALRRVRPDAPVLRADCPRYHLEGQEAARHLLRVACGADSQVLGDVQVLGQVRQAGGVADEAGTLGPRLRRLLGHAVRAGRRAREETAIGRGAASLGSALASLLSGRGSERILVLGAGDVARDIGRHLAKRGLGPLWFVNRTEARAAELAAECRGASHPWSALETLLREADVVIAATSALVLGRDALDAAAAARPERPLLVVDAGVPRNVEAGSRVPVLDLDAIRERQAEAVAARQAALPEVEAIVADEVERFGRWVERGATEDLIRSLFAEAAVASREAAGLLAGAEPAGPAEVERVFVRSFKRLLHGHVRRLRAASPSDGASSLAAAPGF
jgi:glutamyl-tRNA reductase